MEPFEYLAEHLAEEAVFNEAMSEATRLSAPAIVAACGLTGSPTVADLGGGNGTLLATLLSEHPAAHGVLFDNTPSGLRDAERTMPADPGELASAGLTAMSDLCMLLCTGGKERTEAEFRALLAAAGLADESITRCAPPVQFNVLRAVPTG